MARALSSLSKTSLMMVSLVAMQNLRCPSAWAPNAEPDENASFPSSSMYLFSSSLVLP